MIFLWIFKNGNTKMRVLIGKEWKIIMMSEHHGRRDQQWTSGEETVGQWG